MDMKTIISARRLARNTCILLLSVVFSISPASAAEKAESTDVIEEVFVQTYNKFEVEVEKNHPWVKSVGYVEISRQSDRITTDGLKRAQSRLYLLYQSLKLFD